MARTESRTKTAIWADADFRTLSGNAQRVYWMLYSQSTISLCGVLALTEKRWASYAEDTTVETITAAMDELADHHYLIVDRETEEVFIRTFARHDGVHKNSKTWFGAWERLRDVSSPHLREAAEAELAQLGPRPTDGRPRSHKSPEDRPSSAEPRPEDSLSIAHPWPIDRLSMAYRYPIDGLSIALPPRPQSPAPSPHLQPPVPSPPPGETGDVVLRTENGDEGLETMTPLQRRMHNACTPRSQAACAFEAVAVTRWAQDYVSEQLVDEAIGWALAKKGSDDPVRLPRAIARTIREKAKDAGIAMPEYCPQDYLRLVSEEARGREAS